MGPTLVPSQRITTFWLLFPFLLAACAGSHKNAPFPPDISQADLVKIDAYGEQVRQAISEQMPDNDTWSGKECTVMISILPDGMLVKVEAEKGDPELCQAAVSAVARAKIPPAPDAKTGEIFKKAYLDFAM